MNRRTHDLCASTGTYRTASGEEKKRWTKCGTVFTGDDGRMSIKLDAVPVGNEWSGWFNLFPVNDESRTKNEERSTRNEDNVPF